MENLKFGFADLMNDDNANDELITDILFVNNIYELDSAHGVIINSQTILNNAINQLIFKPSIDKQININCKIPINNRTYNIVDVGVDSDFIVSNGEQTIRNKTLIDCDIIGDINLNDVEITGNLKVDKTIESNIIECNIFRYNLFDNHFKFSNKYLTIYNIDTGNYIFSNTLNFNFISGIDNNLVNQLNNLFVNFLEFRISSGILQYKLSSIYPSVNYLFLDVNGTSYIYNQLGINIYPTPPAIDFFSDTWYNSTLKKNVVYNQILLGDANIDIYDITINSLGNIYINSQHNNILLNGDVRTHNIYNENLISNIINSNIINGNIFKSNIVNSNIINGNIFYCDTVFSNIINCNVNNLTGNLHLLNHKSNNKINKITSTINPFLNIVYGIDNFLIEWQVSGPPFIAYAQQWYSITANYDSIEGIVDYLTSLFSPNVGMNFRILNNILQWKFNPISQPAVGPCSFSGYASVQLLGIVENAPYNVNTWYNTPYTFSFNETKIDFSTLIQYVSPSHIFYGNVNLPLNYIKINSSLLMNPIDFSSVNSPIEIKAVNTGFNSADLVFSTAPDSYSGINIPLERMKIKADGDINILSNLTASVIHCNVISSNIYNFNLINSNILNGNIINGNVGNIINISSNHISLSGNISFLEEEKRNKINKFTSFINPFINITYGLNNFIVKYQISTSPFIAYLQRDYSISVNYKSAQGIINYLTSLFTPLNEGMNFRINNNNLQWLFNPVSQPAVGPCLFYGFASVQLLGIVVDTPYNVNTWYNTPYTFSFIDSNIEFSNVIVYNSTSHNFNGNLNIFNNAGVNNIRLTSQTGRLGLGVLNPTFQLQLSLNSAGKPTSTSWTVASDERVKENIINANLNMCYEDIKQLKIRRFKYKDDFIINHQQEDKNVLGFIAQEVKNIFPKSVNIKPNELYNINDFHSLNIDQMIISLFGAFQMLQKKVEILENKLSLENI